MSINSIQVFVDVSDSSVVVFQECFVVSDVSIVLSGVFSMMCFSPGISAFNISVVDFLVLGGSSVEFGLKCSEFLLVSDSVFSDESFMLGFQSFNSSIISMGDSLFVYGESGFCQFN